MNRLLNLMIASFSLLTLFSFLVCIFENFTLVYTNFFVRNKSFRLSEKKSRKPTLLSLSHILYLLNYLFSPKQVVMVSFGQAACGNHGCQRLYQSGSVLHFQMLLGLLSSSSSSTSLLESVSKSLVRRPNQ